MTSETPSVTKGLSTYITFKRLQAQVTFFMASQAMLICEVLFTFITLEASRLVDMSFLMTGAAARVFETLETNVTYIWAELIIMALLVSLQTVAIPEGLTTLTFEGSVFCMKAKMPLVGFFIHVYSLAYITNIAFESAHIVCMIIDHVSF